MGDGAHLAGTLPTAVEAAVLGTPHELTLLAVELIVTVALPDIIVAPAPEELSTTMALVEIRMQLGALRRIRQAVLGGKARAVPPGTVWSEIVGFALDAAACCTITLALSIAFCAIEEGALFLGTIWPKPSRLAITPAAVSTLAGVVESSLSSGLFQVRPPRCLMDTMPMS